MNRMTGTVGLVAGLSAMLLAGCGGGGGTAALPAASTPQQAIQNAAKSIEAGNKDGFVGAFDANATQKEVLGAMFDSMVAMQDFRNAMVAAYGEDAVKKAEKTDAGESSSMLTAAELANVKIDEQGDTATAALEGKTEPMKLVKKNGLWLLDCGRMAPADENQAKMATKMGSTMAEAAKKAKENVGKPGETAESCQKKLGEAIMAAMFGGMIPSMPMVPGDGGTMTPPAEPGDGGTTPDDGGTTTPPATPDDGGAAG